MPTLLKRLTLLAVFMFSASAYAMNGRTTYQAKIIKPDGYPLEASSVNFRFSVLDSVGSCVLYVEDYIGVNMTGGSGLISFALGNGARSFPVSGTSQSFAQVFDNSIPMFNCQTPGTYNPGTYDTRKIVMQFNDGSGWQTLPAMSINAVPYAMYAHQANNSKTLNGKADTAFVENATLAALNCNSSTHAITFNGVSFSCLAVGSGGGGISSVTTSGSVLVTGGSASAPVISITAATMSQDGYLTAIDYAEFKSKLSASSTQIVSTLGYAPVSGAAALAQIEASATSSATADTLVKRNSSGNVTFNDVYANAAKVNYVDIYRPSTSFNIRLQAPTSLSSNYILNLPTTSGTAGQVLSTDGVGNLSWISAATGSVTSVSGTANEILSTGGSTPTLSLANIGTAGTYFKVTTDSKGRITSGVTSIILADLPASVLNTTSNFSGDISGMISNITVNRIQGVSVTTSSLSNNDILQYDGSKYVNKNIPSCSGNYYLTFNGTNFSCALDAGSSGTITTLSVTSPISSTGGANPTLSMAQANSSTNGYLASSDWTTFNNKQNATSAAIMATLGYVPAYATSATQWITNGSNIFYNTGNVGLGVSAPTAHLNLGGGSASLAPLKFSSGTLLSSPQSGAIEYDGFNFYLTDSANTRRIIEGNATAGNYSNVSNISSSGNISIAPVGSLIVSSTTASTNSNTGALVISGGLGIAGNINTAANLNVSGSSIVDGSLRLSSLTEGSVLFTTTGGTLSQDNSNFFWDNNNKRLGIGTNAPLADLQISNQDKSSLITIENLSSTGLKYPGLSITNYMGATTGHPYLTMSNFGGSSGAATATPQGRIVMALIGAGHSGSGTVQAGRIQFSTEGTFSTSANPTAIQFLPGSSNSIGYFEAMRITSNGYLGIGTAVPAEELTVSKMQDDDTSVNVINTSSGLLARSGYTLTNSGTAYGVNSAGILLGGKSHGTAADKFSLFANSGITSGIEIITTAPSANIVFKTNAAIERMRITTDGKVGIGTNAPTANLEISDSNANASILIRNETSTAAKYPGLNILNFMGPANAGFPAVNVSNFRGTSSTVAQLQTGDNVGVFNGQASSNSSGTIVNVAQIEFEAAANHVNGSTPTNIIFWNTPVSSTSLIERMRIAPSGNVGIGTALPDYKLTVPFGISVGDAIDGNSSISLTPLINSYLGSTGDVGAGSTIWILLAYNQSAASGINSSGFDGQIRSYRGSTATWNNASTFDVAVKTAFNGPGVYRFNTSGPQSAAKIVTLTYLGNSYLALQIPQGSAQDIYLTGRSWGFKPVLLDSVTNSGAVTAVTEISNPFINTATASNGLAANVGIGISSPQAALDVSGTIKHGYTRTLTNSSGVTFTGLNGNADGTYEITITGRLFSVGANKSIRLGPNGSFVTAGFKNLSHRFYDTNGTVTTDVNVRNTGGLTVGFTDWNADGDIVATVRLMAKTGRVRLLNGSHTFVPNVGTLPNYIMQATLAGSWTDTTTNITSLAVDFESGTFTGEIVIRTIQP